MLLLTDRMETGGAETHIAMLARELHTRGRSVAVLSSGGRMAEELEAAGIRQYRIPTLRRSYSSIARAKKLVKTVVERDGFDILHAHARIPALLLRGCKRWKHSPSSVVTIHAAFQANPLLSRICYWGEQTIAVSEDLRACVCDRFRVPAEAVTVIPNGIDCTLFSPPSIEPPHRTVLFASRLDNDCSLGAECLCRLAPRLAEFFPDLQITIAGGGNALPSIQALASQAANQTASTVPCIRLLGTVSDMPSLYRSHRIFVGVSRAAMEAAASGCAVLLCGNEGYGGLLSPSDPIPSLSNFCCRGAPPASAARLEEDLLQLLSSDPLCRTAAQEGRAWMQRSFSAQEMATHTLAVYRLLRR